MILSLLCTIAFSLAVIAQLVPNDLVVLVLPLLVWFATTAVNWIKSKIGSGGFGGSVVVTLFVPVFSLLSAYAFEQLANPALKFWQLVALGLLGTFFNELVKQWTQTFKGTQTSSSPKLSGLK